MISPGQPGREGDNNGMWYWWSCVCEDFLAEYGRNEPDLVDSDIEITHWMPLPEPQKG